MVYLAAIFLLSVTEVQSVTCNTNSILGRWNFSCRTNALEKEGAPREEKNGFYFFGEDKVFLSVTSDGLNFFAPWDRVVSEGRDAIVLAWQKSSPLYVELFSTNSLRLYTLDRGDCSTAMFSRSMETLPYISTYSKFLGTWKVSCVDGTASNINAYVSFYPQSVFFREEYGAERKQLGGGEWTVERRWWRSYLSFAGTRFRVSFDGTNSFFATPYDGSNKLAYKRCPPPEREWMKGSGEDAESGNVER